MLRAVVEDFSRLEGITTQVLLHESRKENLGHICRRIGTGQEEGAFRELASQSEATLVIAPESEGILAKRSQWVLEVGGKLLGSSPSAVDLAGDKWALASFLAERGIPTPATILVGEGAVDYPAVLKPRHGAGSQATFMVHDDGELKDALEQGCREVPNDDFILQPHVPGLAASIAFLRGPGILVPLPPARQYLSGDGRFLYQGGEWPLDRELADRAVRLAGQAVAAVDGLQGYVGVDLVLGGDVRGRGDRVIEINPRLTTSYVGLQKLARANLARAWLDVLAGKLPELKWNPGPVRFFCGS